MLQSPFAEFVPEAFQHQILLSGTARQHVAGLVDS